MYPDGYIGSNPAPGATGEKHPTSTNRVARER